MFPHHRFPCDTLCGSQRGGIQELLEMTVFRGEYSMPYVLNQLDVDTPRLLETGVVHVYHFMLALLSLLRVKLLQET